MALAKSNIDFQSTDFGPDSQLDLFADQDLDQLQKGIDQKINNNIFPIKEEVDKIIDENQSVFFSTKGAKFFNIDFQEDNENFYINFFISRKNPDEESEKHEPLVISIDINKTDKYNNISIKHSDIKDMAIRIEVMKYFLTSVGFHELMEAILTLENTPKDLLKISYNHKKFGTLQDYKTESSNKYRGKKLNLGKVQLSHNHFPDLYILKDNSSVNFRKNRFNFTIELEINKQLYTVKGNGLKTINNTGNYSETLINVDISNFEIHPNIDNESLNTQIKNHIIYYIQEL